MALLPTLVWTMGWRVPRAARGLGGGSKWWCVTPCLRWMGCCAAPGALTTADHDCVVGWRGRAERWCAGAGCCAPGRRAAPPPCPAVGGLHTSTHRQTVRADQRARGPQRDGIARAAPNHQSEPPGRRRVGEKPTRLRENAWKFRGSKFPPVRETNTVSQGKRLRRCLFLLFGSTESEAVFVSFVWVNSCRKD